MDEKMALEKKLSKAFVKAMATYRLIEDGDKILVGLSGGKDSLCLLELLAKRSRINFPKFCVEAIHIRMENVEYESDTTYLEDFAEELELSALLDELFFEELLRRLVSPCGVLLLCGPVMVESVEHAITRAKTRLITRMTAFFMAILPARMLRSR